MQHLAPSRKRNGGLYRETVFAKEMHLSTLAINPYGAIGFGVASLFAIIQGWSLPEFCWSTWLAGLFYSWGCIAVASLQIIRSARSAKPAYDERFPLLRRISPTAFLIIMTGVSDPNHGMQTDAEKPRR